jgi:hypothetical protein
LVGLPGFQFLILYLLFNAYAGLPGLRPGLSKVVFLPASLFHSIERLGKYSTPHNMAEETTLIKMLIDDE